MDLFSDIDLYSSRLGAGDQKQSDTIAELIKVIDQADLLLSLIHIYKTLSLPGAYSVDKYYRLARHLTWYKDEQLDEKEMELGRNLCRNEAPFDLVLSHTCPYPYEPTDLFLAGLDQSTVDSTMERYLGEIEFNLDYKRWAFGHFHADRLYPWADGRQMLMLFNENVVNLDKFMNMTEKQSFKDIIA